MGYFQVDVLIPQQSLELQHFQVDAASIVGSHQIQELNNKHKQEMKELHNQLKSLAQINDDLKVQLQVGWCRFMPCITLNKFL